MRLAALAYGLAAGLVESNAELEAQPGDPTDWFVPLSAVTFGLMATAPETSAQDREIATGFHNAAVAILVAHLAGGKA